MRWLGLVSVVVVGCSVSTEAPPTHDDALIGGDLDARHVAVGAFVTGDEAHRKSFCTGTLISPRVVVTAKHCTVDMPGDAAFAFGADARHPTRVVGIDRFERALPERGGWMRLGSDVAGIVLAEAVTDVAPVPIATRALDASDLGKSVIAVGYGAQGSGGSSEVRKAGALKVAAVTGSPLKVRYPSLSSWLDAAAEHVDHDLGEFEVEDYTLTYSRTLLTGYEAYLSDTSVQTCHGDSGGPMLRPTATGFEVVAVVSGGPLPGTISHPSSCGGGNLVGIVTSAARDMLLRLAAYPDTTPP